MTLIPLDEEAVAKVIKGHLKPMQSFTSEQLAHALVEKFGRPSIKLLERKEHLYYWSDDTKISFKEGLVNCSSEIPKGATDVLEQTFGWNACLSKISEINNLGRERGMKYGKASN